MLSKDQAFVLLPLSLTLLDGPGDLKLTLLLSLCLHLTGNDSPL